MSKKKDNNIILIGFLCEVILFILSGGVFLMGFYKPFFFILGPVIALVGLFLAGKVGDLIGERAVLNYLEAKE